MTRDELFACIEEIGILPAVRVCSAADAVFASQAVLNGGIRIVEITTTIPCAVEVISELVRTTPDLVVGAGTVIDLEMARRCLDVGAAFLTSPGLDLETVEFARTSGVPLIPGALTPTEVMAARKAGADFIKLFPCASVGGPSYVRALQAPFPGTRFIASGGVNQKTAGDFIRFGAAAIGVGKDLLPREAIRLRDSGWIRELARRFMGMVKDARAQTS